MDRQQQWTIYFAGIVSIRLHPRNKERLCEPETEREIERAATVADLMLKITEERWPG